MKNFNKKEFIDFALENRVVGFKAPPFELNSGRISSWYVNWRNILKDVYKSDILTDYIIAFTDSLELNPDTFHGVREGASLLGALTQYKWAKQSKNYGPESHSFSMGRGKSKDHGDPKDKDFVGYPKGKIIVLEDVTTTALSLLEEIVKIREAGEAEIIAVYGLTNRMESTPSIADGYLKKGVYMRFVDAFEKITGKFNSYDGNMSVQQAFEKLGILFYALSDARELLPEAFRRFKPNDKILSELKKQLDNPFVSLVSYSELIGQDDLIKDERIYKPTVFGSS